MALQLTESGLRGVTDRQVGVADTTLYFRFYDKQTGLARTPQSTTLSFVIDVGSASVSNSNWELITCTSHSTASGITTAVGCTRSLAKYGSSTSGGTGLSHPAGAEVGCVDVHLLWNQLTDILNGTNAMGNALNMGTHVISGLDTPVLSTDAANKAYVLSVVAGIVTTTNLIVPGNAGETVAAGNLVYFDDTDDEWKKCDADTAGTVDNTMLGIAQGAGTNGAAISGGVLVRGLDANQTGLTAGTIYYASNTAGGISSSAGTTEVTIGFAYSTTQLYFNPRFNQQITEDQQDALVGTSGTPSLSNKYVTADDVAENTASKVVRRKSDSNITVPGTPTATTDAGSKSYIDSSVVRPFYQAIGMNGFSAGLRGMAGATSDTDGTMFVASVGGIASLVISRFALDAGTKMYYRSHTQTLAVTGNLGSSTVAGIAVVGTYIYVHVSDSSPAGYLRRYDKTDLANVTSMTYSGTAPDTGTSDHVMYSNGTDIIIKSATTTWYRYTISGTTATNAATVTFPDASAAVYDGSKVYAIISGDTIGRYATTGGSVEASTDFNIDAISDNDVYRGLALFDTTRIYFIRGVQNYDEAATVANSLHLYPFTKP